MDKTPTQRAYLVESAKDDSDRTYWTEIGALWPHKDGKGSNLLLKGGGRIVIRDYEDENRTRDEADL
jgi:hypothetical protein